MSNPIKKICYGGYYSTGGSVTRDIIRELKPNINFPNEFRLIKERHGLLDLHHNLFSVVAPENIDEAFRDFDWLVHNLNRNEGYLSNSGFSYSRYTNDKFSGSSQRFLEALTSYEYPMWWHFRNFRQPAWRTVMRRFENKLRWDDPRKRVPRGTASMSLVSEDEFFCNAQGYIDTIAEEFIQYAGLADRTVGLHNAIPIFRESQVTKAIKMLGDARLVITDRDPRDIFMNYPKDSYGRYLPNTDNLMQSASHFAVFFERLRKEQDQIRQIKNVKLVNFEDFVENYEATKNDVLKFIGLNDFDHTHKFEKFDPSKSRKNVGMWRNARGQMKAAISLIEERLAPYLVNTK